MPIPRTLYVILNLDLPQFSDARVRQALSLAIDRAALAGAVMRDPNADPSQLFSPTLIGWHDPSLEPLVFDPAGAASLLDEAGWQAGSDGIRTKGDDRLSFSCVTYNTRAEVPAAAEAIQAYLAAVGVDMRIEQTDWTVVPERQADGTLEAAMMSPRLFASRRSDPVVGRRFRARPQRLGRHELPERRGAGDRGGLSRDHR